MTLEEERTYISRVLDGDKNAFEALILDNQKKVYNLALKMTGDENDALDISQEAFCKAYTALHTFRADSRFSVWIYRLTYNQCIDLMRKKSRSPAVSLTMFNEEGEAFELQIPDMRGLPESEAERSELRCAIRQGISELPEHHRTVLLLREEAELSYADIAATLDISEGTVKSRIARARQALMAALVKSGTFSAFDRHKDRKGVE